MTIEASDIEKLAHLSRIGVHQDETQGLIKDLDQIIQWVGLLQAAPTENIEPLANTLSLDPIETQRQVREDQVTEQHSPESMTRQAKTTHDHFFIVPQVL